MISRLGSVSLLLASIVLSLLLAETYFRVADLAPWVFRFQVNKKESAYLLSDNPILGYELKRNFRGKSQDCHHSFPYTNSFGFRDQERDVSKRSATKRVIFLGDSVVAGHGICDLRQTIPGQLEQLFPDGSIEALNFGIGGYCTRAEVELLKVKGLAFQPDVVVLFFVGNDYVDSNGSIINTLSNPRPAWTEFFFARSHLFRYISVRFNLFKFGEDIQSQSRLKDNAQAIGPSNVEQGLQLLKQLATDHNFDVVIAIWPYFTDREILAIEGEATSDSKQLLQIEQLAKDFSFPTLRLSPYFEKDFRERVLQTPQKRRRRPSPRWNYTIGDGTHPSEQGAKLAAEAIREYLAQFKTEYK